MQLKPTIPMVSDKRTKEWLKYLATIHPKQAELSTVEEILSEIGKIVVAGADLPTEMYQWITQVPRPRLYTVGVVCRTVLANANFVAYQRVESVMWAMTALECWGWLADTQPSEEEQCQSSSQTKDRKL